METRISSEEIYKGKVVRLTKDIVSIDGEKEAYREIVHHRGGACIALEDEDHKFFMVKQYRYSQGEEMLEFCAGKLEEGEVPDEAIKRECVEELGWSAKDIRYFGYTVPTCGYSTEKIYLYYGKADKKLSQNFDEDERINVEKHTLDEIRQMILEKKITDAKTIALVYYIEHMK